MMKAIKTTAHGRLLAALVITLLLYGVSPGAESKSRLGGSFELGYRYRSDGTETDQDLSQRLSLDYFRPWGKGGTEFGFVFSGYLQEDVDGGPEEGVFNPFWETADAYDNSIAGWVYLAYAEVTSRGVLKALRLGRQDLLDLEPISFDGGLVSARLGRKFTISAYGGLPTNLYEDDRNGDSMVGAHVDYRVLKNLSLTLGYLMLRDKVELLDGTEEDLQDDLILFKSFWRATEHLNVLVRASALDGEFRDAAARGVYRNYDWDLAVSAFYKAQFIEREAEPLADDPFSILLGPLQPYQMGGLTIYKGIGKKLGVEGGGFFRELLDSADESTYNHSYQRYMASLYVYDLPFKKSQWVFGGDYWISENVAESYSIRGEFSQRFMKRGKFHLGTSYDLYKIDVITGDEEEDVQTYYAGLLFPVGKHLYARVDYSFEDGSLRETDTLLGRLGYEF